MKIFQLSVLLLIVSVAARSTPAFSDDMYELATALSKVTRAVDTAHRYGSVDSSLPERLFIQAAVRDNSLLQLLSPYDLILHREGSEVILLLCDGEDRALLADTGCSAKVDAHYWRQETPVSCVVDRSLLQVCAAGN